MIQFQQRNHRAFLHGSTDPVGHAGKALTRHWIWRLVQRWACLGTFSVIWGPAFVHGETLCQPVTAEGARHDDVLLAGFGFQSPASSSITIRTYQAHTGTVLSEDSYDLNVQEEATTENIQHGRIFAGGIAVDAEGRSRFLLRVYDALSGRFLWEGQLHLTSQKEERHARPIAMVTPSRPSVWRTGITRSSPVDMQFSLRAVDSQTGRLVWEERFTPGAPVIGRVERTGFLDRSSQIETIGHAFDLMVRAFDRPSGRLLWQDSFEDIAAIAGTDKESGRLLEPGSLPFRNQRPGLAPLYAPSSGRLRPWVVQF